MQRRVETTSQGGYKPVITRTRYERRICYGRGDLRGCRGRRGGWERSKCWSTGCCLFLQHVPQLMLSARPTVGSYLFCTAPLGGVGMSLVCP